MATPARSTRGRPDVREPPQLRSPRSRWGRWTTTPTCCAAGRPASSCWSTRPTTPRPLLAWSAPAVSGRVVTTHQHRDHWQALAEVVAATGARTARRAAGRRRQLPVPVDVPLDDGDRVRVGERRAGGHPRWSGTRRARSPCSTTTRTGTRTCSPATRCSPAASATTRPRDDFASLIDDVEHKLFDRLPDDTWFYPGHGNDSTLGAERAACRVARPRLVSLAGRGAGPAVTPARARARCVTRSAVGA